MYENVLMYSILLFILFSMLVRLSERVEMSFLLVNICNKSGMYLQIVDMPVIYARS
jgi:hypothetical protein